MKRVLGSGQQARGGRPVSRDVSRVRRMAAGVLALGLVLAGGTACGSDDDGDDSDMAGAAQPFDEEFSVLGALGELPVTEIDLDKAVVSVADLDAASEAGGVERPSDGSREALLPWLGPLTGMEPNPVFVPIAEGFNHSAAAPSEFAEIAGWSLNDVAHFAEISAAPHRFTVATGLDDDVLADSLVDSGDGVRSSTEGEDFEVAPADASAVDRLGRAIRFLQRGNAVGFGTSTPLVNAWGSEGETLADHDPYGRVAAALDDQDVVSAVLVRATEGGFQGAVGQSLSAEQLAALEEKMGEHIPADPFDVVGIGWDADGEVHVAYHFADADAAQAGVDVLEKAWREGSSMVTLQPFAELVTVEDADVEGSVAVITVIPVDERATRPWQMLQQREPVFVSP